jgi:L-aspartate oxidase
MWDYVSIKRTPQGLLRAYEEIEEMLGSEIGRLLRLRLLSARSIVAAAQARCVSVGVHFITQES